mgnify:CR=1 FL=1
MSENENEMLEQVSEEAEVEKEEIVLDLLNPMVIKLESQNELHSKVSIEPFERGFGYTLGNAIRRVLLSSLPGYAITEAQIDGVLHEYTTIEGVQEDVVEILLNLKGVAVNIHDRDSADFVISKKGPCTITAGDIQVDGDTEIVNPDHHIATISAKKELKMQVKIEKGTGYRPVPIQNKESDVTIGLLKLDASFSPVVQVTYNVDTARVKQRTDLDKLIIDLKTNETIEPEDAIRSAGQILRDQLEVFTYLEVKDNIKNPFDANAAKPVDWSNGRCPPANPVKGQIILGYAHKNNTCGLAGNMSCIKANIGDTDKDGNDDYLEKEINLCEF